VVVVVCVRVRVPVRVFVCVCAYDSELVMNLYVKEKRLNADVINGKKNQPD